MPARSPGCFSAGFSVLSPFCAASLSLSAKMVSSLDSTPATACCKKEPTFHFDMAQRFASGVILRMYQVLIEDSRWHGVSLRLSGRWQMV